MRSSCTTAAGYKRHALHIPSLLAAAVVFLQEMIAANEVKSAASMKRRCSNANVQLFAGRNSKSLFTTTEFHGESTASESQEPRRGCLIVMSQKRTSQPLV